MTNKSNALVAACAVTTALAMATAADAGELKNPRQSTQNLEYGNVLKIRLPYGMCEFERVVPQYVVDQLRARRDWNRLVEYMLVNCPDLGLPLADTATASITDVGVDDSGDGTSGNPGPGAPDGSGSGTPDSGGSNTPTGGGSNGPGGNTGADDDGNNGHGNDPDRHDESNPGKSGPGRG